MPRLNRIQTRTNKGVYGPDIALLQAICDRLHRRLEMTATQKRRFAEMWPRWQKAMPWPNQRERWLAMMGFDLDDIEVLLDEELLRRGAQL
jgi:hypothetical protein